MGNLEIMLQDLLNTCEDPLAFLHVHIGNADVAGKGVQVAAKRPDVDIVNLLHALDAEDGSGDKRQLAASPASASTLITSPTHSSP